MIDSDGIRRAREAQFVPDCQHEATEIAMLNSILAGCRCFVDVGANVGQYTWFASRHMRGGEILAIEADPDLAAELATQTDAWAAESGNKISVIHSAVTDQAGEIRFYRTADITTGSIWPDGSPCSSYLVPARRLDDLITAGAPTVIKIDIEGAEYRAIAGARRLMTADNVAFFVELHGWGDRDLGKFPIHIARLFRDSGYAVERIGTHYLFQRSSPDRVAHSYRAVMPLLLLKFVYRTQLSFLEPLMRALARVGLLPRL
jgi:FkbM family methyltransferase